ncbi:MAG: Fur family transcriptional regulator [Akkermansiaceae bacterium]|jgi:Fur family peroxide stress response transcriptional regulator
MVSNAENSSEYDDIPHEINGLRMTRQRREVYKSLMENRVHPTAQDVFLDVKERLPQISLATVYNCLEALTQHGIIRQVHFDRESCRYCPNLHEHGHFHDQATGKIHDITFKPGVRLEDVLDLPPGTTIANIELTLRGTIAHH